MIPLLFVLSVLIGCAAGVFLHPAFFILPVIALVLDIVLLVKRSKEPGFDPWDEI